MSDQTLTDEARRTLAALEAARVRQTADRASSQKRGIVIAGIAFKVGLALLSLGVLAAGDWPSWIKIVVVILGAATLSIGHSQLIWALREFQESVKRLASRNE